MASGRIPKQTRYIVQSTYKTKEKPSRLTYLTRNKSKDRILHQLPAPKLRPAQPSGGAWREATVRNRKRVARALRASQDFTGVINNALGISYNLRFLRRIDEQKE